jgi:hypothetical protein
MQLTVTELVIVGVIAALVLVLGVALWFAGRGR